MEKHIIIYIVVGLVFSIVVGYGTYYLIMKKLCKSGNINWIGKCTPCGGLNQECCKNNNSLCVEDLGCSIDKTCTHCGHDKEACCADNKCIDSSLICKNGSCTHCGDEDKPCCPVNNCNDSSLTCKNGFCLPPDCGVLDLKCCKDNKPPCAGIGSIRATCETEENTCNQCGVSGTICCEDTPFCSNVAYVCSQNYCIQCGNNGGPCCADNSCLDKKSACIAGTCKPCGALEDPCCPGNYCNDATMICTGGICKQCGQTGDSCCPGKECADSRCEFGTCTLCGGVSDGCCKDTQPACDPPYLCDKNNTCSSKY